MRMIPIGDLSRALDKWYYCSAQYLYSPRNNLLTTRVGLSPEQCAN